MAYLKVLNNYQDLITLTLYIKVNIKDKGTSFYYGHKNYSSSAYISFKK